MGESTTLAEERRGGEKEDRRTWVTASSSNDGSFIFLDGRLLCLVLPFCAPFISPCRFLDFQVLGFLRRVVGSW